MAKLFAGASSTALSYAHLAGIVGGRKKARADDAPGDDKDDKKDSKRSKADEEDPDDKDARAEGDDDEQDTDDGDQDEARAEGDDDQGDDKDDKSSKRSKAKADDEDAEDDDEEEMHGKGAVASARRREQARISAILGSRLAVRAPTFAAHLALNTRMTRGQALAALKDAPAEASAASGSSRAGRNPDLGPGGERDSGGPQATASRWDKHMSANGVRDARKPAAGTQDRWNQHMRSAGGR